MLWEAYRKHHGPNGAPLILVAKGTTRDFNPTISQEEVDRELERDPVLNSAEYLAEFRRDVEGFVTLEAVMNCTVGILERPPQPQLNYYGFVDPSFGSVDSFSLAVGHYDFYKQTVLIDCLREAVVPYSPEMVCREFAQVLQSYRINRIVGDRVAGQWAVEQFSKFNIFYEQSAKPKSDLYVDLLALLNSRRIELPDHVKMRNQLCNLERRVARGGHDSIDHPRGGHDDLINSVAGVAALCLDSSSINYAAWNDTSPSDPLGIEGWRRYRLQMFLESGGAIDVNRGSWR